MYVQLADRESGFDGVGVASALAGPVPDWVLFVSIGVTFVSGLAYTVGWQYRRLAPLFAVGWLALGSYRGSWGQLLHFENLFVLHLLIVGLAPAADRWSLDARAGRRGECREPTSYGWPIALAAMIVVITYLITGLAKLRYGGLDWIFGDTLRNHVAYAAARLDVLGADPSPLAAMGCRPVVGVAVRRGGDDRHRTVGADRIVRREGSEPHGWSRPGYCTRVSWRSC